MRATFSASGATHGRSDLLADREPSNMPPEPIVSRNVMLDTRSFDADDAALLRRIAVADKSALEELYRQYHRRLVRFLGRLTRRNDVIEEVINDTFMIVWRKAGEFRGQSQVSTWLMGVAYRVTLKALRSNGLVAGSCEFGGDRLFTEPFTDHETADWLHKGMMSLTPEQRIVMELAYVMGHSLEEIAEITKSPVSTVKARMFHARVKLRNILPALAGDDRSAQ
ncbi:RNA polymerase sigma factor [Burkholderia cepacia]|uniref:RNA polymerase sigma factor n=1 Tax=Burkholderia cepacia TaxID=292 RepID=UPI001E5B7792|nr:sigma-70 family RNA polymerase sigma factor [Burkholderia cepacia]